MLKVILFNDQEDTPQDFKGITSYYRNRVDFAEIKNNSVEICQKYGIFNFPEIVLLKYDENI